MELIVSISTAQAYSKELISNRCWTKLIDKFPCLLIWRFNPSYELFKKYTFTSLTIARPTCFYIRYRLNAKKCMSLSSYANEIC